MQLHSKLAETAQYRAREHVVVGEVVVRNLLALKRGFGTARTRRAWRAFCRRAVLIIIAPHRRTSGANRRNNAGLQYVHVLLTGNDLASGNARSACACAG
jgi:hypothetical protein